VRLTMSHLFLVEIVTGHIMTVARPTRTERNAARKTAQSEYKRKRVTAGSWTFTKAAKECVAAGFELHKNARIEWDKQTAAQSHRKMLMKDGRVICMDSIMTGHTRAVPLTAEQRAVISAKISATRKQVEHKQKNWLERASFEEAMCILDKDKIFEFATVPDGLGADFLVRRKRTELWAAVQVKSAVAQHDEQVQFGKLKSEHGKKGGKYEHVVILGVGVAPGCVPPDSSSLFDAIADVEVTQLFVYNRASDMPGKTLKPYPRKQEDDVYGDHRFCFDFDTPERLDIMCSYFEQCIEINSRWSKADAWFGTELNPTVSESHKQEVLNCKALGDLLGHERLRAPNAQHETVDVVLELDDREVRISLKTAPSHGKTGFKFKLGEAVNNHFCDVVLTFYNNKSTQERTHVSVIASERVYVKSSKHFGWSPMHKQNKDVWNDRIDLRAPDAAEKLLQALS
jgi:hypothetical protein